MSKIHKGRPPSSKALLKIEELMPEPQTGMLGASIRKHRAAAKIAAEIVLRTRPQKDIATAYGVNEHTLRDFRRNFVTPTVRKGVMASMTEMQHEALNEGVAEVQHMIHSSLVGVIMELRELYGVAKEHLETQQGDEYLARLGPLVRLLDSQGRNVQRLADSFAKQAQNEAIITPLNEHPQVGVLLEILRTVFLMHPDARDEFFRLLEERKLILEVE